MKKKIIVVYSIAAVLALVAVVAGVSVNAMEKTVQPGKIPQGYSVNGIAIGGKTPKEAAALADALAKKVGKTELIVNVGDAGTESVSFAELGVNASADAFIDKASKVGTEGNLIERYMEIKDAEEKPEDYKFNLQFDATLVDKFVKDVYKKYKTDAVNATLTRQNGQFIIGHGQTGRKIYYKKSLDTVNQVLSSFELPEGAESWDDPVCSFDLVTVKPKYDEESLAMVTDVLGTYTTNYGSSTTGRATNVENGCRLVNGILLMPGEQVSVNDRMYPYTIENGYAEGGAYVNGKIVADVGGGICQVSTTLYNAVLYAELEVVERFNHSMTVDYVPLSRDAAIAGDWKDFVFRNNTEYPVYVEGIAGGGNITFNVYGHETRDTVHRKLEFESKVLKTIPPEKDNVTIDKTKPAGFMQVTQGAYTGYESQLIKKVLIDGKVTEESVVNSSKYKAVGRYVIKGPDEKNASGSAIDVEKKGDKEKKASDSKKESEKRSDDDGKEKKKSTREKDEE